MLASLSGTGMEPLFKTSSLRIQSSTTYIMASTGLSTTMVLPTSTASPPISSESPVSSQYSESLDSSMDVSCGSETGNSWNT